MLEAGLGQRTVAHRLGFSQPAISNLNACFSLYRKVLKEISVGELKPNETVQANLEAQLLSQLNHPTIVRFYTSFLEHNSFCIITEYCESPARETEPHQSPAREAEPQQSPATSGDYTLLPPPSSGDYTLNPPPSTGDYTLLPPPPLPPLGAEEQELPLPPPPPEAEQQELSLLPAPPPQGGRWPEPQKGEIPTTKTGGEVRRPLSPAAVSLQEFLCPEPHRRELPATKKGGEVRRPASPAAISLQEWTSMLSAMPLPAGVLTARPAMGPLKPPFPARDFVLDCWVFKGKDLDCKINECKEAGKTFPESQVLEWFIQLLLGVHYTHERRILHRDLKTKNIFLKNNIVKIGDFGVSCLLMGSCDLATTFTGTPYYMSPEALNHQGYNSKSDIWSLACILYEMCCLDHAFTGNNFLSVVLKIVEGETPSLPDRYSKELNSIMERMLNKSPSLRLSAAEILREKFIEEHLQNVKSMFSSMTLKDETLACQKEAAQIRSALQKKVHLQTLRERSEVQKMTPRERMRLRKLQDADEKARKLKQLAEEKYQENYRRMQELRSRNFQQISVDVLNAHLTATTPALTREGEDEHTLSSNACAVSRPLFFTLRTHHAATQELQSRRTMQLLGSLQESPQVPGQTTGVAEIPEDPQTTEEYYYEDGFESCSDEEAEFEDSEEPLWKQCIEHVDRTELGTVAQLLGKLVQLNARAQGRSIASLVVARRQLWLSKVRVQEPDKVPLLDAPITPGHTFGLAVEEMLQRPTKAREASQQLAKMWPSLVQLLHGRPRELPLRVDLLSQAQGGLWHPNPEAATGSPVA
ncbi:UNVERIFIED_CONTAM: hypothetical protein FKN15_013596 [Acipenser sinensis]